MSPRDAERGADGGPIEWTRTLYREIETGWSEEDDAYLARWVQHPEIGVQADGETREEAVANLISATGDYFGAIRADGSALRDGAEGAGEARRDGMTPEERADLYVWLHQEQSRRMLALHEYIQHECSDEPEWVPGAYWLDTALALLKRLRASRSVDPDEASEADVAREVLCRVFDDVDEVLAEWRAFDKSGWMWWGRALGAFIRRRLNAQADARSVEASGWTDPKTGAIWPASTAPAPPGAAPEESPDA